MAADRSEDTTNSSCLGPKAPDLEDASERRYRDLLALSKVSAAVSGLRDLDAILGVALDNVLDVMNGTVGGILLLDQKTQTLTYRVHRGLSETYAREMRLSLGEGIAGRVAQTGAAVLLEDISADPRAARPDLVATEGLRAFISVPLRAREAVLGVLNVASYMSHHFTKDDMYLLHSIGDQVGVAIENAKLQERLIRGQERYRHLARLTLIAQEEERRRIAGELHDETSQALSGLALHLQALVHMADTHPALNEEFKTRLKKTHSLAVQIGVDVSRLMKELRPTLLDTQGLVPAIHQYAENNLRPLGIAVTLSTEGDVRSLPSEIEVGLFRVAQGAIGNVAQHSRAKSAVIAIECKGGEVVLRVNDDGEGFAVSDIIGIDESGRGRGLFSMKERVALLGGTCFIKSQPGEGCTVVARVPVVRRKVHAKNKGPGGG